MTIRTISKPPSTRITCRALAACLGLALVPALAAQGDATGKFRHDEAPSAVTGGQFRYLQIAGSAFHPYQTGAQFAYSGDGCIQLSGAGEDRMVHKLLLPQGAEIRYLRLYFFDNNSAESVNSWIYSFNQTSGFTEILAVASTDTAGYGSSLSPETSYFVDHYIEPLVVTVNLGAMTDGSLRFCGVRIAYTAADSIFADGFDD